MLLRTMKAADWITEMSYIDELLVSVRSQMEASPDALAEARARLQLVRGAAGSFPGALRTYRSGSLPVHTMNCPVTDGDGGLILNRVYYPALGPDGGGEAPADVAQDLCDHLGPLIRETYPDAVVRKSKRGPKVYFGQQVEDQDPTVDMVVAMNRKEGAGIWIPDLEAGTWEASDPEKHVGLLNGAQPGFRSTRRKIIRLAKAWNKQFYAPGVSSFQLSVWALEFVEPGFGVAKGLATLFDSAASRLEAGEPTSDPAGVSPDLRLLKDAKTVADRLRKAADAMETAMSSDEEDAVREAASLVFPDYIDSPQTNALKSSVSAVASKTPVAAAAMGINVAATISNSFRAYGGGC